jgi:hypothetical protein
VRGCGLGSLTSCRWAQFISSTPQEPSREERVNEVIAEFLQAVERGEKPDPEKFLAAHPDLAADLNSFFANRDCFQEAAGKPEQKLAPDANEATLAFQGRGVPSPRDVIRYFGDYELLEEIARGGMGVVFKARQVTLNRIVAVKMILAGSFAGPEDVERFHTEAEAAAQLDHPGIVPIYEVGQQVDWPSRAGSVADGYSAACLPRPSSKNHFPGRLGDSLCRVTPAVSRQNVCLRCVAQNFRFCRHPCPNPGFSDHQPSAWRTTSPSSGPIQSGASAGASGGASQSRSSSASSARIVRRSKMWIARLSAP